MPTLEWIGKSKVINHHQEVPFRVLEEKYTYNNSASENKIIHGDNLEALKALLPEYEGRIDCIYIDPPYNTGNEGWVYNDNVNDPKIKKWLGEVVGDEEKDLTRHDKWLCMMYPRLRLLQKLMSDEGIIFISIGDDEVANLKQICDEIFGKNNFLTQIIVRSNIRGQTYKQISKTHEYLIVYMNNPAVTINEISKTDDNDDLNLVDDIGKYNIRELRNRNPKYGRFNRPNLYYPVYINPNVVDKDGFSPVSLTKTEEYSVVTYPLNSSGGESVWRWGTKLFENNVNENTLLSNLIAKPVRTGGYNIYEKYRKTTFKAKTIWADKEMTNEHGTLQLGQFNLSKSFDYPKPVELVERCIQLGTKPESIVLDSFAGSGTTAHAVLNLNKADGGLRKFILIEMGEYAEDITAKRVKNLISGYKSTKKISTTLHKHKLTVDTVRSGSALKKADSIIEKEKNNYKEVNLKIEDGVLYVSGIVEKDGFVPGLNGDFTYYELGKPVLKDDRTLNEDIPVAKIHSYIWHTETHTPYNKPENENPTYLGEYNHTAYYFHYKKEELTALDYDFLAGINIKADSYVIYADTCLLSQEELSAYNITFKKIPRDITKI